MSTCARCVRSASSTATSAAARRWPAHVYKLYLLCERLGGEPVADGVETESAEFFVLGGLPPLSVKTPPDQLERALAVALDPALPAALD